METSLNKNIMHTANQVTLMPKEPAMRAAVAERDVRFDGAFVYGVLKTGVYCRPSCPSRRVNPGNVSFFRDSATAEAEGLRACKRCYPNRKDDHHAGLMQELARYIEKHASESISLKALSDQALLSPFHLQRLFKSAMGVSPKVYHDAVRMRLLKEALKAGKGVLEAINEAGFQSTSRVYGQAMRTLGMTPSTYRSGGAGETIAYAFRKTSLGPLLMAATDRGVCFAQFGLSERALIRQLNAEFPHAAVRESDATNTAAVGAWIELFEAHIAAGASRPDVPLDLRGTAFQIRVWRFLLSVPEGDIVSYTEVASAIGSPKAIRAAAAACGANRIAVLVPCHRVLRGDGGLGGYRWGLERKRMLIERERTRRGS